MGSFPPSFLAFESLPPSVEAFATESSNASRNEATVNLSVRNTTTKELVFKEATLVDILSSTSSVNFYKTTLDLKRLINVYRGSTNNDPPTLTRLSISDMGYLTPISKLAQNHFKGSDTSIMDGSWLASASEIKLIFFAMVISTVKLKP